MRRIILVGFLFLLCKVVCADVFNKDFILKHMDNPNDLFKAYYSVYEKQSEYDLNSELGVKKYKIFKETIERITRLNKEAGKEIYGITQFSDMTLEEKRSRLVNPAELEKGLGVTLKNLKSPSIPDFSGVDVQEIDYRRFLNDARDQKGCGSCWSFAAMGAVEGKYNLQFSELKQLSEQYLVDCDDKDNGCGGGWPTKTFEWLVDHGVRELKDRPYQEKQYPCDVTTERKSAMNIVTGQESCDGNCTFKYWYSLLQKGPVIVAMDASSSNIYDYKPGDAEYPFVPTTCVGLNHAVVAVGIRVVDNEIYLLIRNSWGQDWGIKGYFLVPAKNHCYILDHGWLPIVQKEGIPFPEKKCTTLYTSCEKDAKANNVCGGIADAPTSIGGDIAGWENTKECLYWNFFTEPYCKGDRKYKWDSSKCFKDTIFWGATTFKSGAQTCVWPNIGCFVMYTKACFGGTSINICNSVSDFSKVAFSMTDIKSFLISSSMKDYSGAVISVVFFDEINMQGHGYGLPADSHYNVDDNADLAKALQNVKSMALILK